jgi:hypothetical protein
VAGAAIVGEVAGLYALGASSTPYVQPSFAALLYLLTPLVALSAFVLFLAPGGLLVLALGRCRGFAEWLVLAFAASLLLTVVLGTGLKLALGTPLVAPLYLGAWIGVGLLAAAWLLLRAFAQAGGLRWPFVGADLRRVAWACGAVWLGVVALLPKLFWENFNLDGIEAFEFGRSLGTSLLPRWEIQDGVFGFYSNFVLFAYPNHWFIVLFGPFEAAARLPYFLYLVVLFAALVLLIEHQQARRLGWLGEAGLWLGLGLYTVVQAFNTNYEPFFADLAETPATDTLQVAVFASACYALWAGRLGWFGLLALMTYVAAPGGLALLGALGLGTLLARPSGWKAQLKALAAVVGACLVVWLLYEALYNRQVLGGVNDQFSTRNMLRRLYPPNVTDFTRWNALLFTSGLLPALSAGLVLARRGLDRWAAVLALTTLAYFGLIYLQTWASLHQFTPAMVLPLAVFWRLYQRVGMRWQRLLVAALGVSTAACLVLSLPRHFQVNLAIREFGLATDYRVGDYDADYEAAVRAGWSLYELLPRDYRLQYPEQPWGTDHLSWIYYATRPKPPGTAVNYIIQPEAAAPPAAATRLAAKDGVAVFVRDPARWQRDRDRDIPRVVISPLYEPILRHTYAFFRAYVSGQQAAR